MNKNTGILGRKIGMTQFFNDKGQIEPVTVVEAGPIVVTQVKTTETDGYNAIQVGFATQKEQRVTKALKGHFAKAGVAPTKLLREFRMDDVSAYSVGQQITVGEVFTVGQKIDVTGTSKGRGFSGVMKRHNFAGFIRSHGTHEFFRHGGSLGTRLTPGHVAKGKKMPGHEGDKRTTVQNLVVAKIDAENNLLFIRGGIPGARNKLVMVRGAVKA